MTILQILFIGVMSCMYVLWDVIGVYFPLQFRVFDLHAIKMIPSAVRSIVQMQVHLLRSVAVVHLEVSIS
jgi:hypothetical protein